MEIVKKTIYEENGNINKKIENLKTHQKEVLEMKNTLTKIKNSLEGFKGRFEQKEKRIQELEHKTIKIIKSQEKKEKRLNKSKENLRDLWDIMKWTNIGTVGVPEGKKR